MIRAVHAFDVLGDPVRRQILEVLAEGEQPAGAVAAVIQTEFGISQPAVSQHLRVLRETGFTTVRPVGARRFYAAVASAAFAADAWASAGQNRRNMNHCVGHCRTTSSWQANMYCVRRCISRILSAPLPTAWGKIGGNAGM